MEEKLKANKSWDTRDISALKSLGRKRGGERKIYLYLAHWLVKKWPEGKVWVDPSSLGIDIVQQIGEKYIGFEVKIPLVKQTKSGERFLDPSPICDGIGQALGYFQRGMDLAYLVHPEISYQYKIDVSVLVRETSIGLILFDKHANFTLVTEAVSPSKKRLYTEEWRKIMKEVLEMQEPFSTSTNMIHISETLV